MKKKAILIGAIILIALVGLGWLLIPQDTLNRAARKTIELTDADYRVTFVDGSFQKVWIVKSGKVASEGEKGYYFFFSETGYAQSPIRSTIVEKIK